MTLRRRGISAVRLISAASLVAFAFIADVLLFELGISSLSLFFLDISNSIELMLVIDIPLFAGAAAVILVRRGSAYVSETSPLALETGDPSNPDAQAKVYLEEKLQEYQGAKEPEKPETAKKIEQRPIKVSKKDYAKSPEKLKVPAFVCRCGHPHRFVCLNCGMTLEKASKKKGMHWVEWVPEMGAFG